MKRVLTAVLLAAILPVFCATAFGKKSGKKNSVSKKELREELVILGRSPLTAMPFLAASPEAEDAVVAALRGALAEWSLAPGGEELRRALCMKGFSLPSVSDYAVLAEQEAAALRLGYPCPV